MVKNFRIKNPSIKPRNLNLINYSTIKCCNHQAITTPKWMNHLQKYRWQTKIESTCIRPSNSFAYIIEKSSSGDVILPTKHTIEWPFPPLLNVVKFAFHCPTIVTSHMLQKKWARWFFSMKRWETTTFWVYE
jgi:hypothetical protein